MMSHWSNTSYVSEMSTEKQNDLDTKQKISNKLKSELFYIPNAIVIICFIIDN